MRMNNALVRSLMRMVPDSVINEIPQIVTQAINKKLQETKHVKGKMPVVLIIQDRADDTDCMITISNMDLQADFDVVEQFSGKEFIKNMIKEAGNG